MRVAGVGLRIYAFFEVLYIRGKKINEIYRFKKIFLKYKEIYIYIM